MLFGPLWGKHLRMGPPTMVKAWRHANVASQLVPSDVQACKPTFSPLKILYQDVPCYLLYINLPISRVRNVLHLGLAHET